MPQESASSSELKKMNRKQYRDYMAQKDRVTEASRTGRYEDKNHRSVFDASHIPSRYYKNFDRGAARYAKRQATKRKAKRS